MHRRSSLSLLLLTIALLAGAQAAYGQTVEVTGRVTDANEAVMQGAEISITNAATGNTRKAATNDDDYYTIPLLQPGTYCLTAQKAGFKPVARDDVTPAVGQTAKLDFTRTAPLFREKV